MNSIKKQGKEDQRRVIVWYYVNKQDMSFSGKQAVYP